LERAEKLMVRLDVWGELKNRLSSKELNDPMSVVCVADMVRQGRLRWVDNLV